MIVLVVFALLDRVVTNNMVAGVGAYFALAASLMGNLPMGGLSDFIGKMPFAADGLGWIVPALVGCIIGAFIRKSDKMEVVGEKIRESMDENTQAESDN